MEDLIHEEIVPEEILPEEVIEEEITQNIDVVNYQNEGFSFDELLTVLNDFYENYIVDTANGSFQVFKSFTYGEMVITFLLFAILLVMILRFVYEVVR